MKTSIPALVKSGIKSVLGGSGKIMGHMPRTACVFSDKNAQIFFGYYDVNPFSADDQLLLACRAPTANISPHIKHPDLEIGFYDLSVENPKFKNFSSTRSWNWQQGCRLQWVGEHVIYNTVYDDLFGAVIQNPRSGQTIKSFRRPIYSVCNVTKQALSLDFAKLHECRQGYGYSNLLPEPRPYIMLMNLDIGTEDIIFTLDTAQNFETHEDMKGAAHYFNHLSFSPHGKRFMVTHLWVTAQSKRRSRILIMNLENKKFSCPDNSGRTSHYCWLDDDKAVIFNMQGGHRGQYILHDIEAGQSQILFSMTLGQDGHPSITNDVMLTDTYPDLFGLQHLIACDRHSGVCETVAKIHSPQGFSGEIRCDLHPRFNTAKSKICIDAVQDGRRAMILLNWPKLKN